MSAEEPDRPTDHDPLAQLEQTFIVEFLARRGHSLSTLRDLPKEQADALLREASLYASGRLTEVESRAHFVDDIHHGPPPGRGKRG